VNIISLGAGVQSTTMALMAANGEITPMPDCAIFADTGAEPDSVYRHLDWLEKQLPFPVHRVMWAAGLTKNIEQATQGGRFAGAPFFALTKDGAGPLRRQCTREFKIQPIVRKVRELVGLQPGKPGPRKRILAEQWIGISMDETIRMKPSRIGWIKHRWPLIEAQMTRRACLKWNETQQMPVPPRSACVFCPYKSDHEWRLLRDTDRAGWDEAIRVDAMIRDSVRGIRDPIFVHRSLKPLDQVDLSTAEDHGQLNLFNNECEGMCGV
jgi:hypothetical protein